MTDDDDMAEIKDIFDFYQRWSSLRPRMMALMDTNRTTPAERMILSSMIDVVDRVGPSDLRVEDDG